MEEDEREVFGGGEGEGKGEGDGKEGECGMEEEESVGGWVVFLE